MGERRLVISCVRFWKIYLYSIDPSRLSDYNSLNQLKYFKNVLVSRYRFCITWIENALRWGKP